MYIEREALLMSMMHGFHYEAEGGCNNPMYGTAIKVIHDAPAAEVVEVVRCKDCKHFRRNLENDTYCNCVGGLTDPEENDFCSCGERRNDDG